MQLRHPILLIALIGLLASGIAVSIFNLWPSGSSMIRETHTRFAISQMSDRLGEVRTDELPIGTNELIALLRASRIDWNTCKLEGDQILDGWHRPITATFDDERLRWTFCSPGKDGKIGTEDDIEAHPPAKQPGEQNGAHQPATRRESKADS